MRLLTALHLLVEPSEPTQHVTQGDMYFDSSSREPRYHDGFEWVSIGQNGFANPNAEGYVVPDGRQVMYFDRFTNNGVLAIAGTGMLVGVR